MGPDMCSWCDLIMDANYNWWLIQLNHDHESKTKLTQTVPNYLLFLPLLVLMMKPSLVLGGFYQFSALVMFWRNPLEQLVNSIKGHREKGLRKASGHQEVLRKFMANGPNEIGKTPLVQGCRSGLTNLCRFFGNLSNLLWHVKTRTLDSFLALDATPISYPT